MRVAKRLPGRVGLISQIIVALLILAVTAYLTFVGFESGNHWTGGTVTHYPCAFWGALVICVPAIARNAYLLARRGGEAAA